MGNPQEDTRNETNPCIEDDVEMASNNQVRIEFFLPEEIISRDEYKFYYLLMYYMFTKTINHDDTFNAFNEQLSKINHNLDKQLTTELTINNIQNIISYLSKKGNNWITILEHIIFQIFVPLVSINTNLTLNFFVFDNQQKLRKKKYQTFFMKEMKELLIKNDLLKTEILQLFIIYYEYIEYMNKPDNKPDNPFQEEKLMFIEKSPFVFLFNRIFKAKNEMIKVALEGRQSKFFDDNSKLNSLNILEEFICSLFIINRIYSSPLNPRIKEMKNIKFSYDLTIALIQQQYCFSTLLPIGILDNIKILNLSQNHLDEVGFYELGRRLTLDKSIEEIELSQMKMGKEENGGLKYFLKGIGNCKLTNIKYLNLTYNAFTFNCGPLLMKLLDAFPNLETLILNKNTLQGACAFLFSKLNTLYRNNQTKLERLVMVSCDLDISSIVELSQLVKSHKCGLKSIVLNYSDLGNWAGEKFLHNMSYNKSIEELLMYHCGIDQYHLKKIKKMIICSGLNSLYLFRNRISDIDTMLKLLGLTLVENYPLHYVSQKENGKEVQDEYVQCNFYNFDISENDQYIFSDKHLQFLIDYLLDNCGLRVLDILKTMKTSIKNNQIIPGYSEELIKQLVEKLKEIQERTRVVC